MTGAVRPCGYADCMRSVDEHLSVILSRLRPLPPFEQHLLDAHGHYLAEDVEATRDLPAFDNSAMDGYAVRLVDVLGADQDTPGDPGRGAGAPGRLPRPARSSSRPAPAPGS